MVVENVTRGVVLAEELERAETFWTRFRGLQLRASFPKNAALWLSPCSAIHTMWVRFPIDVLFLDKAGCVLARVDSLRPWRVSRHVRGAVGALEFVGGSLAKSETVVGDCIAFENGPAATP